MYIFQNVIKQILNVNISRKQIAHFHFVLYTITIVRTFNISNSQNFLQIGFTFPKSYTSSKGKDTLEALSAKVLSKYARRKLFPEVFSSF